MNKILFIGGLCIALAAAALLVFNIIESGVAAMIGILGIGLMLYPVDYNLVVIFQPRFFPLDEKSDNIFS